MSIEELKNSDKLNLFLLGLLDAKESAEVEELLLKHPELLSETNETEEALTAYANEFSTPPPSHLKAKVLDSINELNKPQNKVPTIETKKQSNKLYPIAASILLAVCAGLSYKLAKQNAEINDLSSKIALNETKFANKNSEFTSLKNTLNTLYENNVQQVKLKSTDTTKNLYATLFYDKVKKKVLVHQGNLEKRSDGMQYQLWALIDGKPISAGVFNAESNTDSLKVINANMNAQLFAISIEKNGGALSPTPERIILISAKI